MKMLIIIRRKNQMQGCIKGVSRRKRIFHQTKNLKRFLHQIQTMKKKRIKLKECLHTGSARTKTHSAKNHGRIRPRNYFKRDWSLKKSNRYKKNWTKTRFFPEKKLISPITLSYLGGVEKTINTEKYLHPGNNQHLI